MSELKRTQLYDVHVAAGAEMVDFGGWEMPIQYPSGIIAEHLYTRQVCSPSPAGGCTFGGRAFPSGLFGVSSGIGPFA